MPFSDSPNDRIESMRLECPDRHRIYCERLATEDAISGARVARAQCFSFCTCLVFYYIAVGPNAMDKEAFFMSFVVAVILFRVVHLIIEMYYDIVLEIFNRNLGIGGIIRLCCLFLLTALLWNANSKLSWPALIAVSFFTCLLFLSTVYAFARLLDRYFPVVTDYTNTSDYILEEYHRMSLDKKGNTYIHRGHVITAPNSTVIVDSTIDSFVQGAKDTDKDVLDAIKEIGELVKAAQNKDASDTFEDLVDSIRHQKERRIRAYWNDLVTLVPQVEKLGTSAVAIMKLFSG